MAVYVAYQGEGVWARGAVGEDLQACETQRWVID